MRRPSIFSCFYVLSWCLLSLLCFPSFCRSCCYWCCCYFYYCCCYFWFLFGGGGGGGVRGVVGWVGEWVGVVFLRPPPSPPPSTAPSSAGVYVISWNSLHFVLKIMGMEFHLFIYFSKIIEIYGISWNSAYFESHENLWNSMEFHIFCYENQWNL